MAAAAAGVCDEDCELRFEETEVLFVLLLLALFLLLDAFTLCEDEAAGGEEETAPPVPAEEFAAEELLCAEDDVAGAVDEAADDAADAGADEGAEDDACGGDEDAGDVDEDVFTCTITVPSSSVESMEMYLNEPASWLFASVKEYGASGKMGGEYR